MEKRVFGAIFLLSLAVVLTLNSVNVSAIHDLGACDSSTVGKTKTGIFHGGCGSAQFTCTKIGCPSGAQCFWSGFYWRQEACVTAGSGACCKENSCGYADYWTSCDACKACGYTAACDANVQDGNICKEGTDSGYCGAGTCSLDTNFPTFSINQKHLFVSHLANLSKVFDITFDIDFFDNIGLKHFKLKICKEALADFPEGLPAPIIADGCAEETYPIIGTSHTTDWKMSKEMWDWALQELANEGILSVEITVVDGVDNANSTGKKIFIVNDRTAPKSTVTHEILREVSTGKEVKIISTAKDVLDEVVQNAIFVDGDLVKSCAGSTCEATIIYSEGTHSYYSRAFDRTGNNATSSTGSFAIKEEPATCEESFGTVCSGGAVCDKGTFTAADTSECCPGSCAEAVSEPLTCRDQEGKLFNSNTQTCEGNEVVSDDSSAPLRCCIGIIKDIPQLDKIDVRWEDDSGNKIASAALGEPVKCKASGTLGNAKFTVLKEGEEMESKTLSLPGALEIAAEETGNYLCSVEVNGKAKTSELEIIQLPAARERTALPVFDWTNAFLALTLIFGYYLISNYLKRLELKNGG